MFGALGGCVNSVQLRSLLFLFLAFAPISFSRGQVTTPPRLQTAFVFFQRAEHHVKNGNEHAFQEVVDNIQQYLRANRVTTAGGPHVSSSGAELPLSDMLEMAGTAKATILLYIVIDRPAMKPLKVTITCFDTMGRRLWQEESSPRALSVETVDHPERVTLPTLQKMREKLNSHLGQPGLIQVPAEQAQALTPLAHIGR
jgi:hypothetical protein